MSIKRALAPALLLLVLSAVVLAKGDAPPRHDAACQKTSDCGFTHLDEGCCWECGVPACGQASVRLACEQGRCTR